MKKVNCFIRKFQNDKKYLVAFSNKNMNIEGGDESGSVRIKSKVMKPIVEISYPTETNKLFVLRDFEGSFISFECENAKLLKKTLSNIQ